MISSAIAAIISLSLIQLGSASNGPADNFYHLREPIGPGVWTFGNNGVSIYSIDGEKLIKRLSNDEICEGENCAFREAISDGSRHVYASNSLKNGTIDVFSVATGDFVNSLDTCGSPWSLEYHPVRDELWVHCWAPDAAQGDTGHVDVFSGRAMNSPMQQVTLHDKLVGHAHGSVEVDSSLGHFGYATDLNTPSLFKMDLNTKEVIDTYEIDEISGLYRMAYSPVNKHLYLRTYVCCSCGFTGADLPACGRGGARNVTVETGPNPGDHQGTCGHGCEGSVADTVGVMEFDTVTGNRVANWHMKDGLGADPHPSAYGDHIFLFGNNGGQTVRILKPRTTGSSSQIWADVEIGLNADLAANPTAKAVSDSLVIKDRKHDIVIFSSTLSNEIALVDMSGDVPVVAKILLTESETVTSGHGRGAKRNLVWPTGSDFVWIDSSESEEYHIIELSEDGDITKARLKKTVTGQAIRQFLYVENYWARAATDMIKEEEQGGGTSTSDTTAEKEKNTGSGGGGNNVSGANQGAYDSNKDKTIDSVGISGLVIGSLALVVGIFNVMTMMRRRTPAHQYADEQFRDPKAENV